MKTLKVQLLSPFCKSLKSSFANLSFQKQTCTNFTVNRSRHRRCTVKKLFLEISQNSQENTCARVSFLKRRPWQRCLSVYFTKFLRKPFLQNTSWRLFTYILHSIWSEKLERYGFSIWTSISKNQNNNDSNIHTTFSILCWT